jgi:uncharacterized protein YyaL (SSP411 family)
MGPGDRFGNAAVATLMNRHHFLCIKGDREERPDGPGCSYKYGGSAGGGRSTFFLTAEAKPFYGDMFAPGNWMTA